MVVAMPNNKTTFRIDLPNSTKAFIENMRLRPEMGLILLPLNFNAFGAKFNPPTAAWVNKFTITIGTPTNSAD